MKSLLPFLSLFVLAQSAAQAAMIYQITFEEPQHHIGSPPATGGGQGVVAVINSGTPLVVNTMPLLAGNSLQFTGNALSERIGLKAGDSMTEFILEFDLVSQNLGDSDYAFSVGLQGSEVPTFDLHGGFSSMRVFQALEPQSFLQPFFDNQKYNVEMTIDQPADAWKIKIDGAARFAGTLGSGTIGGISIGLGPWRGGASSNPGVRAYLDNVQMKTVPEPGTAGYLLLSALLFARRKRMA